MIRAVVFFAMLGAVVRVLEASERRRVGELRCAGCDREGGPLCNHCLAEAGLRMAWGRAVVES